MNAEHEAGTNANLETGKTNKTLKNNNTSFSGSFCLEAQKQKNPHKKNIFQPTKKWDRYQIVRKYEQNTKQKNASCGTILKRQGTSLP